MPELHSLTVYATEGEVRLSLRMGGMVVASHTVAASSIEAIEEKTEQLLKRSEGVPPAGEWRLLGNQMGEKFLGPLLAHVRNLQGQLWIVSTSASLLNLPYELLTNEAGNFLFESGLLFLRRASTAFAMVVATPSARPGPLRVLFMASSPQNESRLSFEKEEEAMIKLSLDLGSVIHLEIEETGTFDGLREKIASYRPHVVHLSGHGTIEEGQGYFCFEDERGRADLRPAEEMARLLFQHSDVRLVFISGCESAVAGVAGVCQSLVQDGHVPVALGWGASVLDGLATEFACWLYRDLGHGRSIDIALDYARKGLLARCLRHGDQGQDLLHGDFALPRLFAASPGSTLVDPALPVERPPQPAFRYQQIGDSVAGLVEGFVGRRRNLQRTRPPLRDGDGGRRILLLTGIGGAGKSTLATRLANSFEHEGWLKIVLKPRPDELPEVFASRLLEEIALSAPGDPAAGNLLGDHSPLGFRLRLAIRFLNGGRFLLILDNLESLMAPPPAAPEWKSALLAEFFTEFFNRFTDGSRAILTSRYVPAGLDPASAPLVIHEPMPDFTEADFFKCLEYDERIAARFESGELTRELFSEFYRKLGATPRFVKGALDCLANLSVEKIQAALAKVGSQAIPPQGGEITDELLQLQQDYFADLFLPQLYAALSLGHRAALSRLAVSDLALPLDGVAAITGLVLEETSQAIDAWLRLGLVQQFPDREGPVLYAIYPLEHAFLTPEDKLSPASCREAHRALAGWLQACSVEDREKEIGLHFVAVFAACLAHARAAREKDLVVWATQRVASHLIRLGEFRALRSIAIDLLKEHRVPYILKIAADAMEHLGEWPQARAFLVEAMPGFQAIGERAGEAATWHQLGTIDINEGNYPGARENLRKSLEIKQAVGDRAGEAATLHQLGTIDLNEGNYAGARENLRKSLEIKQAIGDRAGEAAAWHQLGTIDLREGNYAGAQENLRKSLKIRLAIGDRAGEAATWAQLGMASYTRAGVSLACLHPAAVAWVIFQKIGAGDQNVAWNNLASMASQLELSEEALQAEIARALASFQADGGAALLAATFPDDEGV